MSKRASEVARAAWLYYLEEYTQGEVARELGVSRSTVVRLLQKAKEEGLVRIALDVPREVFEMERELERLYGLERVRLVPEVEDEEKLKRWLGHAAAEVLVEMVKPGATVTVAWGTTLRAMAESLAGEQAVEGARIVPLMGGLHRIPSRTNPYGVAEQLGRHFRASVQALYAPVFMEERSAAEAVVRDPDIRDTLDLARGASLAIFSIGTLGEEATLINQGYLSPEERDLVRARGAVGEIICRWIDYYGNPVELPPTINPIGLSLTDLKNIPDRLAIVGGEFKREALLGTLRGGYTTTLVTDEGTAAHLLEHALRSTGIPRRSSRNGTYR